MPPKNDKLTRMSSSLTHILCPVRELPAPSQQEAPLSTPIWTLWSTLITGLFTGGRNSPVNTYPAHSLTLQTMASAEHMATDACLSTAVQSTLPV